MDSVVKTEFSASFKLLLPSLRCLRCGGYSGVTNEAVGVSAWMTVSPFRTGHIEAYWGGESANGTLFWDMYYGGTYQSTQSAPVGAFVHTSYFDVSFRGWER